MAAKMSRPYKYGHRTFRYDFENALVCHVCKATQKEYDDNVRWQEKFGRDLWSIDEDGFIEIQAVGLMKSNWRNKELRDSYLAQWCDELDEELEVLSDEFMKEAGMA